MKEKVMTYLKPLAEGLMGKRQQYTRPDFTCYELPEMLSDLTAISDETWSTYAFSREPLNGKFDDQQRTLWMQQASACGKEYARRMKREFGTCNAKIIARQLGLKVSYPEVPEKTDRVTFAEYRLPNEVKIYQDAVNKGKELLKDRKVAALMKSADINHLLLSHEIYHHLEEIYSDEIYTKKEKVRLWSIGRLRNDSQIIALSEIAAMAFAKELNSLPYSPYVLDVFLVYGYSKIEASGLYEEMMTYAKSAIH